MERDTLREDFFKSLKVALTNASIYFKEHPLFLKSVEDLKRKTDGLIVLSSSLTIGVAPDFLLLEGMRFEKANLYEELAEAFHRRKIKTIVIRKGVTVQGLAAFLSKLCLSPKDITRAGGLDRILSAEGISCISVEELDYSQLLKGEGEEKKDIWASLLEETVEKEQLDNLQKFTSGFEKALRKFKVKDFLENDKLRKSIYNFLNYLKDKQNDAYRRCTKELARVILNEKGTIDEDSAEKLRLFTNFLDKEAVAQVLWEEVSSGEELDPLRLKLFSQLLKKDKQEEIASSLVNKIGVDLLHDNLQMKRKIKDLFSSVPSLISPAYRKTLDSLLGDISPEGGIIFDQKQFQRSYRYVLLNLLVLEENEEKLERISQALEKGFDDAAEREDTSYIKDLQDALDKKFKKAPSLTRPLSKVQDKITHYIEMMVLDDKMAADLDFFLNKLKQSSFDFTFYQNKIFKENKITPAILKLIFALFPKQLPFFYNCLQKKLSDAAFLKKVLDSLEGISSSQSYKVIKYIFSSPHRFIKIYSLRAMRKYPHQERRFLLSTFKEGDSLLKRECLITLSEDRRLREEAVRALFSVSSPLGIRNGMLEENIKLAEDTGLKEAADYLQILAKKKFFWNKNIRDKARKVLKKWNRGEN